MTDQPLLSMHEGLWIVIALPGFGSSPLKVMDEQRPVARLDEPDGKPPPAPKTIEEVWDFIERYGRLDCVLPQGNKTRIYRANLPLIREMNATLAPKKSKIIMPDEARKKLQ